MLPKKESLKKPSPAKAVVSKPKNIKRKKPEIDNDSPFFNHLTGIPENIFYQNKNGTFDRSETKKSSLEFNHTLPGFNITQNN